MDALCEGDAKKGEKRVGGPINFTTFGTYRTRLCAEEGASTFAYEPFNPPYYAEILDRLGFRREAEALAQRGLDEITAAVARARKHNSTRSASAAFASKRSLINSGSTGSMTSTASSTTRSAKTGRHTPVSLDLFRATCGESFVRKTCPTTSTIAIGQNDEILGFILVYPHWSPLIVRGAGAGRVPLDAIDYHTHWPKLVETGEVMAVAKTTVPSPRRRVRESSRRRGLGISMCERG